jgi:hypothetical protein
MTIFFALLFAGLYCLWMGLISLSRLDSQKNPILRPRVTEEPKQRLTRLGRPIEEVQLK